MLGALVLTPVLLVARDLGLAADRVGPRPRRAGARRGRASALAAMGGARRGCSRAGPACSACWRWRRCRSASRSQAGGSDGEPARAALRRDRRGRAGLARPAAGARATPGEPGRALGRARVGAAGRRSCSTRVQAVYADDSAKALEQVVFFYVPFALLFALLRGLEWTPRRLAWGGGVLVALALVFAGDRLLGVPDAPPAAEPEGDRLQPGRGVLPRQLAVLRPEHLRALPGARDDRARVACCCGRSGRATLALDDRRARRAVGRAAARRSRSRASPRCCSGLAVLAWLRCGGKVVRCRRSRRSPSAAVLVLAFPGALRLDLDDAESLDDATSGPRRPDARRRRPRARAAAARLGLGLASTPSTAAHERRVRPRGDVGLAHDPDHGRAPSRASSASPPTSRCSCSRFVRLLRGARGVAGAGGDRGRLRRARAAHVALRRVPRGPADVDAARARHGARGRRRGARREPDEDAAAALNGHRREPVVVARSAP